MTTPILPDIEALALKALRAAFPDVRAAVDTPADWDVASPLITCRRVSGSALDPRFVDRAVMAVDAWHTDRRSASLLARRVRAALYDACRAKLADDEGSLAGFTELIGPWNPGPDDNAGISRFVATYQLTARPTNRKVI
ncbi:DUF3168 domain-containing protein [Kitasatospora griseola]|uniref:DUF3168 domain-containing protein n=1 Tax=Kitasatospora griseola TaxID=2064 RepID=UPI00128CAA55|nr:DUF3168 domain-containing protein [Kitasatospora griseola]